MECNLEQIRANENVQWPAEFRVPLHLHFINHALYKCVLILLATHATFKIPQHVLCLPKFKQTLSTQLLLTSSIIVRVICVLYITDPWWDYLLNWKLVGSDCTLVHNTHSVFYYVIMLHLKQFRWRQGGPTCTFRIVPTWLLAHWNNWKCLWIKGPF